MDPTTDKLRLLDASDLEKATDCRSFNQARIAEVLEKRRLAAKRAKIENAFDSASSLSIPVQSRLREALLAQGWGKCPHGFVRILKCPKRFGFKLADIAIVATVYDLSVAAVVPTYFVPLSAQEFQAATGMDLRDVRRILSDLCSRGILLKIALEGINFWALNPHFFTATEDENSPLGDFPLGNAPSVKKGHLPTGNPGEIAQGGSVSTSENQKENSVPKNLFQESLKESHLCAEFPEDMLERWKRMSLSGSNPRVEKEKEIFKSMLKIHKQSFFQKCGRVISHLEKVGVTKDGKHQPIHSPISYIQNHWDINVVKFEEWDSNQRKKEEEAARRINQEAKAIAEKRKQDESELKAAADKKDKLDSAAERFLELYHEVEQIKLFSLEALKIADSAYASSFYVRYGWKNHLVREVVLDHFLKCESGERITEIHPERFQKNNI